MNKVIVFYGDDQNHQFYGEVLAVSQKDGRLVITSKDGSIHAEFGPHVWRWFVTSPLTEKELEALTPKKEAAVE